MLHIKAPFIKKRHIEMNGPFVFCLAYHTCEIWTMLACTWHPVAPHFGSLISIVAAFIPSSINQVHIKVFRKKNKKHTDPHITELQVNNCTERADFVCHVEMIYVRCTRRLLSHDTPPKELIRIKNKQHKQYTALPQK